MTNQDKIITNDLYIALGENCRSAHHINCCGLRMFSSPFDRLDFVSVKAIKLK